MYKKFTNDERLPLNLTSVEEVENIIKTIPSNKATGADNIKNELIKHGGKPLAILLVDLFN